MIEEREVTTATCDGCGRVQYHEVADDVLGFHGTTTHRHEQGGYSAEWFACRRRCIHKANLKALDRVWLGDGEAPA